MKQSTTIWIDKTRAGKQTSTIQIDKTMPGKQTSTIQIDKTMPGKKISICTFRIDTKKTKKNKTTLL